jgi:hypothetical protein
VKIWYDTMQNDTERAAVLFLVMKWAQLRKHIYYENTFLTELKTRKEVYWKQLVDTLTENKKVYKGIQVTDVRDLFSDKFKYQIVLRSTLPQFSYTFYYSDIIPHEWRQKMYCEYLVVAIYLAVFQYFTCCCVYYCGNRCSICVEFSRIFWEVYTK